VQGACVLSAYRMPLHRQLAVSLLQLIFRGALLDAKDLIVVLPHLIVLLALSVVFSESVPESFPRTHVSRARWTQQDRGVCL
jgi:hypothetical protein